MNANSVTYLDIYADCMVLFERQDQHIFSLHKVGEDYCIYETFRGQLSFHSLRCILSTVPKVNNLKWLLAWIKFANRVCSKSSYDARSFMLPIFCHSFRVSWFSWLSSSFIEISNILTRVLLMEANTFFKYANMIPKRLKYLHLLDRLHQSMVHGHSPFLLDTHLNSGTLVSGTDFQNHKHHHILPSSTMSCIQRPLRKWINLNFIRAQQI